MYTFAKATVGPQACGPNTNVRSNILWSLAHRAEENLSLVQDSRARLNCPNPSRIPGPSCDAFLRTFEVKST